MRLQVETLVNIPVGGARILLDPCDERGNTFAFIAWHEERGGYGQLRGVGAMWMHGEHFPRIKVGGGLDALLPYSVTSRCRR